VQRTQSLEKGLRSCVLFAVEPGENEIVRVTWCSAWYEQVAHGFRLLVAQQESRVVLQASPPDDQLSSSGSGRPTSGKT
jgi:hypothetical protein